MNEKARFPSQPGNFLSIDADAIRLMVAASSDFALLLDTSEVLRRVICGAETLVQKELDAWIGKPIRETLTRESLPKLDALISQARAGEPQKWRQLNHLTRGDLDFPVSYAAVAGPEEGTTL
ncbi:MAG: hypothetical protein AAFY59_20360, partial [Pseudomonadota bacterium]